MRSLVLSNHILTKAWILNEKVADADKGKVGNGGYDEEEVDGDGYELDDGDGCDKEELADEVEK